MPSLGALTSRRPRRVVVASSSSPRIALSCHPSAPLSSQPLSSPPLSSPLSSPVSSSPDHSAGRRAVVSPCPPLSSPLSSPPGAHHSSSRRRRVYRYPHPSLGESMRRCNDCEGLGGCSEARVVVASSSRRRRLVSRGQEPLRKLVKTAGAGATPAHSRRVVVVASPRSPSPLRPRVRAVLHACSSSSRGRTWRSARAFVEASDLEKHIVTSTTKASEMSAGCTWPGRAKDNNDLNSCKTATAARRDSNALAYFFAQALAVLSKWSLRLQKRPH